MAAPAVSKLMRLSNFECKNPMIDKLCDMQLTMFSYEPVWVSWWRVFGSAQVKLSWQHIRPDGLYRPRICKFSAIANSFPSMALWRPWFWPMSYSSSIYYSVAEM